MEKANVYIMDYKIEGIACIVIPRFCPPVVWDYKANDVFMFSDDPRQL